MIVERKWQLLGILAAIGLLVVLGAAFSFGAERSRAARAKAAQYAVQNAELRHSIGSESRLVSLRDQLQGELGVMRSRFYAPNEMNPYSFGTLIRKKLASHGILVVRYQVIEVKGATGLEFSVLGSIASLVLFLKEVSESDHYWSVSSFSLTGREGTRDADASFRIGYEVRDS
jgi:hypothetical protein